MLTDGPAHDILSVAARAAAAGDFIPVNGIALGESRSCREDKRSKQNRQQCFHDVLTLIPPAWLGAHTLQRMGKSNHLSSKASREKGLGKCEKRESGNGNRPCSRVSAFRFSVSSATSAKSSPPPAA